VQDGLARRRGAVEDSLADPVAPQGSRQRDHLQDNHYDGRDCEIDQEFR